MSPSTARFVPELFNAGWRPVDRRSTTEPVRAHRPPRVGQRSILLSATNKAGVGILLAFTRTRGGIAFWRSLSPEKSGLDRVETFPGPFTPRAVARLLASGAVHPAVDAELVEDSWVDGVDHLEADLLRLAWCRHDGRIDPRAAAVLALSERALTEVCDRTGQGGVDGLLELGEAIIDGNEEWLAKHRASVDVEVDRRAALESAGEKRRRELRDFVEECLLTLGRLPRTDETAERWDGASLAGRDSGVQERRRLGLYQTRRFGRFRVRLHFLDAAGSLGWADFGSGPGWFWDVANPDPGWIMTCTMGPYETPEEAWDDASHVGDEG